MGNNLIIFIGAIQSISDEVYEAAELDGANRLQQFKYIILPSIKRIVQLNLLLAINGALAVFEIPYVMLQGANGSKTFVIQTIETAFQFKKVGLASAMGIVLLIIVIIMGVSLIGVILIGTMLAYVLHRFNFKFKKVILGAFLLATLIPGVTTQVATFQVVSALGIYNTRLAPILLYMGTDIISIYIFLQFMDNISISMDEAAMIEGASYFTIYRKVILPLLKPAIATVVIIKGVGIYNDFYTPFLYMPNTKLNVLSTALFKFKGPYSAQWEVICACIMIVVIPTFIAFLCLQKYIYNGFTSGSVK